MSYFVRNSSAETIGLSEYLDSNERRCCYVVCMLSVFVMVVQVQERFRLAVTKEGTIHEMHLVTILSTMFPEAHL